MDEELIELLSELFDGLRRGHGTFEITSQKENGKYEGKAYTVREPWTVEHWKEHVAGTRGLGIVPIDDDGMCSWGAIDVDIYPLDHNELSKKITELNLPLILVPSKSGGAHLYLFMAEKVTAKWMQETLKRWAKALGYASSEVFPKQIKLASKQDVGNWLNMPYFGDTRKMWPDRDLRWFVDYAQTFQQTQDEVDLLSQEQEFNPEDEMPPCLQILATDGAPEGTRNKVMYNYGVYLKQAYPPEELDSRLHEANHKILDQPLPVSEINGLRQSLERKEGYFYQCNEEPLCSNCDKQLCKTRKFGVGNSEGSSSGLTVIINGLTKLKTDPVLWYMDVEGYRVEMDTNTLFSFAAVKRLCAEVVTKHIGHMKNADWEELLSGLLETSEEVDMPEESGTIGAFKSHLNEFLTGGQAGESKDALLTGRPWYNEEENRYYFRIPDLNGYLDNRKFRDYTQAQMTSKLKILGADHGQYNIKGACVRWWAISPFYKPQSEEFEVKVAELPLQ